MAVPLKKTISTIADRVMEGMAAWQNRPLNPVHPVIFIDCVNVKIRDGNGTGRADTGGSGLLFHGLDQAPGAHVDPALVDVVDAGLSGGAGQHG